MNLPKPLDLMWGIFPQIVFALMIIAGSVKLGSQENFRSTLLRIPFMPYRLLPQAVVLIPIYEISAGIVGVCGKFITSTLMIAPILILFMGVAYIAERKSLKIPCNCFGSASSDLGYKTIYRNIFLLIMMCPSFIIDNRNLAENWLIIGIYTLITALLIGSTSALLQNNPVYFKYRP